MYLNEYVIKGLQLVESVSYSTDEILQHYRMQIGESCVLKFKCKTQLKTKGDLILITPQQYSDLHRGVMIYNGVSIPLTDGQLIEIIKSFKP